MNALVLTNMYPYDKFPFYGMVVKEEIEYLQQENVDTQVLFINGRENRWNYFKGLLDLLHLLSSKNYDIIHTHHTYCGYMAIFCLSLTRKHIPVVLTFHEGEIYHNGKVKYNIDFVERLKYIHFIKDFVINRVNHLITVYEGLLKTPIKTEYSVIPCGVNLELFRPLPKSDCRKKLGINENAKVIFFPSDYRRLEKRFDLVKKAYIILKVFYKDDLTLLHGGSIAYDLMPVYLNASDVVVLTSDYEASPKVIKEAMACNIPILSVDVGDVKKIIDGIDGCYLTIQEPRIIASRIKQALDFNRRTNGRDKIEKLGLSTEHTASKIREIYESLASKN